MENKMTTLWFKLGQYSDNPSCFALTQGGLKIYLDHLHAIGHNMYSYNEFESKGFVQAVKISNEMWDNIQKQKDYCIFSEANENKTKACTIALLQDNIKNYAKALSMYWNDKVTVKGLARMGHNPKCNLFFNEKFNIYESM